MARNPDRPGSQFPLKRRTRGHVLADLSRVHTELVFLGAGYTASPVLPDYGDDLLVRYYDENGLIEPWHSAIQLKATERIHENTDPTIDLEVRDVRHWLQASWPVFVILFDAATGRLFPTYVQQSFARKGIVSFPPDRKTVRVRFDPNRIADVAFARYTAVEAERVFRLRGGRIDYGRS